MRPLVSILLVAALVFGMAACSSPVVIGDSEVALSAPSEEGGSDGGEGEGEGDAGVAAGGGEETPAGPGGEESPGPAGGGEGDGSPGSSEKPQDATKEEPKEPESQGSHLDNADDVNDVPLLTKEKIGVNAFDVTPGVSGYFIVTFEVDGQPDKEVMVAEGETCAAQPTPVKAGHIFKGWFYMDESTKTPFSFTSTIITEDMTVTAEFEPALYSVKYLSADPAKDASAYVLFTQMIADPGKADGSSVPLPDNMIPKDHVFKGEWYYAADPDGIYDDVFDFDLEVTRDYTLAPKFDHGFRVDFVTDGNAVEPQFVLDGEKATDPGVPVRTGYTFAGWYEDKAYSGSLYSFSAPVDSNIVLYAKWTGASVKYTVNYWIENDNIPLNENGYDGGLDDEQKNDPGNFTLVYQNISKTATAGEPISETATQANYANAKAANDAIIAKLGADAITASVAQALYKYSHSDEKIVSGNGTTVINVYFVRTVWRFDFNLVYPSGTNATTHKVELRHGDIVHTGGTTIPVYAKVGLYCKDVVPIPLDQDGNRLFTITVISTGQPSNHSLRGWGTAAWSVFDIMTAASFTGGTPNSTNRTVAYSATWSTINQTVTRYHYYVESLDQDSAYATVPDNGNSERIKIETLRKYPHGSGSGTLSPSPVPAGKQVFERRFTSHYYLANQGDRQVTNEYIGFGNDYVGGWYSSSTSTGNCYQWEAVAGDGLFYQLTNQSGIQNRNDRDRYFFYPRNSYSISFDSQGGSVVAGASDIKFEAPLSGYRPADPVKGAAEFLGWFISDLDKQPFDFDAEAMPPSNLFLTARWLESPQKVEFYPGPAGGVALYNQTVSKGAFAIGPIDEEDKEALEELKILCGRNPDDVFVGWYQKLASGTYLPFSFEQPIVEDTELYAFWIPPYTPYSLSYDLGGGSRTGGGTNPPVESLKYATGAIAAVTDEDGFKKGSDVFIGWQAGAGKEILHGGNSIVIENSNVTLTALYAPPDKTVKITFDPNGGTGGLTNWNAVKKALVTWPDATNLDFKRAGYTFVGWAKSKGAITADSNYKPLSTSETLSDITLYAVWKAIPAPPPPPVTPPPPEAPPPSVTPPVTPPTEPPEPPVVPPGPPVVPPGVEPPGVDPPVVPPTVNPPSPPPVNPPVDQPTGQPISPPANPSVTTESTPQEVLGQIMESGMPSMNVGGMSIPLAAGAGLHHLVWALVNLILAIAGVVLVIAAILRSRGQKNREEEYVGSGYISELKEHEGHNGDVSIMSHGDIIETSPLCPEDEEREQENKRRPGWLAILTVMGIVGVIVFILTEDMTRLMVLVDNWTIVNAIIFIIALISYRYAFKREKEDEYEEEEAMA